MKHIEQAAIKRLSVSAWVPTLPSFIKEFGKYTFDHRPGDQLEYVWASNKRLDPIGIEDSLKSLGFKRVKSINGFTPGDAGTYIQAKQWAAFVEKDGALTIVDLTS